MPAAEAVFWSGGAGRSRGAPFRRADSPRRRKKASALPVERMARRSGLHFGRAEDRGPSCRLDGDQGPGTVATSRPSDVQQLAETPRRPRRQPTGKRPLDGRTVLQSGPIDAREGVDLGVGSLRPGSAGGSATAGRSSTSNRGGESGGRRLDGWPWDAGLPCQLTDSRK